MALDHVHSHQVLTCVSGVPVESRSNPTSFLNKPLWQQATLPQLLLVCFLFKETKTTKQEPSWLRNARPSFSSLRWCCARSHDGRAVLRRQAGRQNSAELSITQHNSGEVVLLYGLLTWLPRPVQTTHRLLHL